MDRRPVFVRPRGETADTSAVRASDLIRAQRAPVAPWSVFVDDVDDSHSEQRRRASRSFVRRRPTEWDVVDDKSESNKENIGYDVRRPKRARRSLESTRDEDEDDAHDDASSLSQTTTAALAESPSTSSPKSNGKRKMRTPTPPKATLPQDKPSKKPKTKPTKSEPEVRAQPPTVAPPTPAPVRRPLEDITHLFIDPTAHYFQPWSRVARVATMRAASVRIL